MEVKILSKVAKSNSKIKFKAIRKIILITIPSKQRKPTHNLVSSRRCHAKIIILKTQISQLRTRIRVLSFKTSYL